MLYSSCLTRPPVLTGIQWGIMDHVSYSHYTSCPQTVSLPGNGESQCVVVNSANFNSPTISSYPANGINTNSSPIQQQIHIPNSPPQMMQKRKRSVNPQADENFVRALEAVRFGGIGFCKAARMYGVNNRTLWLEYKKRGYPNFRLSIKNRNCKQDFVAAAESEDQQAVTGAQANVVTKQEDPMVCGPNHPVALISSAFLEGRHVDLTPMLQRPRYLDTSVVHQQPSVSFQGINFEPV